jgi:hypothetical protein
MNKTPLELKDYLAAHSYQRPKGDNNDTIMNAIYRCQHGLPSCEKYNADELHAFCLARKVSPPSKSMQASAPSLVRMLKRADDKSTFPRFMGFLAELRNRVYELHFRDHDEISTEHEQPPITKVTRQIRAESLPLFYGCATFTWGLSLDTNFCIYEHTFTGSSYTLTKMPEVNIAQIKSFKFHWTHVSRGVRGSTYRRFEFTANVWQDDQVKKLVTIAGKGNELVSQELVTAVRLLIHGIGFGDATWKLQKQHLHTFRDEVNKMLRVSTFKK